MPPSRSRRRDPERGRLLWLAVTIGLVSVVGYFLLIPPERSRLSNPGNTIAAVTSRQTLDKSRRLYAEGRLVDARDLCIQRLRDVGEEPRVLCELGRLHERLGEADRADDVWARLGVVMAPLAADTREATPRQLSLLGWVLRSDGEHELARLRWKQAAEVKGVRSTDPHIDALEKGEYYLLAGEEEVGYQWVGEAIERGNVLPVWLQGSPAFDGRRRDPRYLSLLARARAGLRPGEKLARDPDDGEQPGPDGP